MRIGHEQKWKNILITRWCCTQCTHFLDQNFGESDEITCEKCFKMKDHLGVLINELKSAQLIIKFLLEEIKPSSTGPRNQDKLSSCVECKSYEK